MHVVVWIAEGTWRSCVDAAHGIAPADAEVTLVFVVDDEVSTLAAGTFAGVLGRGRRDKSAGQGDGPAAKAGQDLLARAAERFPHHTTQVVRRGRAEREVVAATAEADLLVMARDGDRSRLGPKSLGHASRFVVDHAPCAVLLVWPESTPDIDTIPPPPPDRHRHPDHAPPEHDPPLEHDSPPDHLDPHPHGPRPTNH